MTGDRTSRTLQTRVQQRFRRGLSTYHAAARAQEAIAGELADMLQAASAVERFDTVLEFGCGTGHLTDALARRFAISALLLNDLVAEAGQAARGVADARGVASRFVAGPIETLVLPPSCDLIASASTIQWVSHPAAVLERLCHALAPGGWLALSGFGTAHFRELAALGPVAAAPNYRDVGDWPALLPPGMTPVAVRQQPIVLEFDSVRDILRHLRATGVNGQAGGHWTRGRLRAYEQAYITRFGRDGRLPLTYDPVMLVARRDA